MLLPAVRLLKKQFPDTQIDWLIDRPIAGLLAQVTEVNVVPIDKPKSIGDYWRIKKQWRRKNTGQLISFQTSFVSNMLMALLPAEHKTGFGPPYSREGHHFFTDTAYELPEHLHQVEIFFALAQKFAGISQQISITADDLNLPVSDTDINWAVDKLQTHRQWIAINPMASTQEKTWDAERYISLIDNLHRLYPDRPVVLTGGSGSKEVAFGQQIEQQTQAPCLNLTGQTTLTQLAAILKQASLLISPDTGPLHLANAMATPVIGLYAVTRPEYIGPYNQLDNCINIYDQAARTFMQKPASQLPWQKKIPSLEAMQLISVEQLIAKVRDLNL
ncbi:hypothetical protein AU255_18075 [Methyloprofundus sedimenti]|uniref:ADP-heptose--LPS heptosyltransferase n=2 Tax=Methyloprofundus sedimenti TaxID=1420851 RepID=A0A1V8M1J4_9GAMM|nr:hypothetical protein AU255_18075 [Methyloprofundus sedimenti]